MFFARRFRQQPLWGFSLPVHPTQRMQRKLLRMASQLATAHDASYLATFELRGPIVLLLLLLRRCGADAALLASKAIRAGAQQGQMLLLQQQPPPAQPAVVAPCDFLFGAACAGEAARILWVTVHPAAAAAAGAVLAAATDAVRPAGCSCASTPPDVGVRGAATANATSVKTAGDCACGVGVALQQIHNLARFELRGPKALRALSLALKVRTPAICCGRRLCSTNCCMAVRLDSPGESSSL
ncbi:hypothetical protein cyc_06381 [Cyclospora cayetanensis]|uniref:Pop1 N-terminal domain-containing protein n=1 Tax=Cyclospora cayetanensis TaxID=88456 RepID=A0A1D3D6Q2_9EIME|nr:hypothetical protein cyc_06381 [Cyclospora cayetanensis]